MTAFIIHYLGGIRVCHQNDLWLLAGYNLSILPDYQALTGEVPVYALQLHPNHMDCDEFIVLTQQLTNEVQTPRQRILHIEEACNDNGSEKVALVEQ